MNLNEELKKALKDHKDWAKPTFGGVWKGCIYAVLVYMGVVILGATGGSYLLAGWVLGTMMGMFYVITKYDFTLVGLWNEREIQRVTSQYIMDNLDKLEPGSYSIDIPKDLDGTNGDE